MSGSGDYERYRRRLDQQLRADVELLFEAYRTKLRAYETVARARGEIGEGDSPPPLALLEDLEYAARSGAAVAALDGQAPAAAVASDGRAPAAATASAPAPPARKRSHAYEVHDAVAAALPQLGEVFDRVELCRALGFEPSRATLYRVLEELRREGVIALVEMGAGTIPNRYRRLTPPAPPAPAGNGAGS
jgi:hypothetical protein